MILFRDDEIYDPLCRRIDGCCGCVVAVLALIAAADVGQYNNLVFRGSL